MKGKIYVLIDPNTNKIRYVGMTKLTLKHRLSLHLVEKSKTYKSNWINKLKKNKQIPVIKQIDSANTLEETEEKEIYWINLFLKNGEKLTNHITTFSNRPYKSFGDKTAKKVIQYDLDGNKIAEYNSAMEAACLLGDCFANPTIYSICNGKKKYTWKGFVFRFEKDSFDKYKVIKAGEHKCPEYHKKYLSEKAKERNSKQNKEYYKMMRSKVKISKGAARKKVINLLTNESYESIQIASQKTGASRTSISRHCYNGVKNPLFKFQDIVQS